MSLTVAELRAALDALSLDSRGTKPTLKARLARHRARTSSSSSRPTTPAPIDDRDRETRPPGQLYDSYLVFDVEATCERMELIPRLAFSYPNEIIEWPVILLQWRKRPRPVPNAAPPRDDDDDPAWEWKLEQVDEFHSYVKPTWRPRLSDFCTQLTGITQADVDAAPIFPRLLRNFHAEFIVPHRLFTPRNKTVWVTDGPWDLRDFVSKTCFLSRTPRPDWLAGEMVDIKILVANFFSTIKSRRPSPSPTSTSTSTSQPAPPPPPPPLPPPSTSRPGPDPTTSRSIEAEPPAVLGGPIEPIPIPTSTSPASHDPSTPPTYLATEHLRPPPNLSLPSVLEALTLAPFSGRLHSGLCDARNLARIVVDLAERRGVEVVANRLVPEGGKGGKEKRWAWMARGGDVKWEEMKKYEERRFRKEREG
ncbi:hypothetical protein JCM10212_005366 [Sporobolomyces blumeae]